MSSNEMEMGGGAAQNAAQSLITDGSQDVTHRLRELTECDHVFVVSQMQVKSNALGDVIGEPPAG